MTNTNKPFAWVNDDTKEFLQRGYLREGQTTQDRVRVIADNAERISGIEGFADKFYDYMSKGYYSLSSPVWSNYGADRGFPVSCFGSYFEDSMESIMYTHAEIGLLSKFGGGTSGYIGNIRPRGSEIKDIGKSTGSVHFMELFDKLTDVVSQGSVRRGFFTPYLPIDHGDFDEFVEIGADEHPIQTLTAAVTVTDEFMNKMIAGDKEARRRWAKVLKNRSEVGYPYIFFTDNVNNAAPQVYKDNGMKIHASNMCAEIALSSNKDESFVCVLSSMNILHYDDWKDTDAVQTLTIFLDTVVTEFINKIEAQPEKTRFLLQRVYNFVKNQRALGLGVLGWHSYLMKNMIAFESKSATTLNTRIFKHIQKESTRASKWMAKEWGEPELMNGTGLRNSTLMAIAPTKSSSFILGQVSMSIEPEFSNYYIKDLSKAKSTFKNPYLESVLKSHNKNDVETWQSIKDSDGSCQHLKFLTDNERAVFKTLYEISPESTIYQAAARQEFIDQAQSLNLFIDPETPIKDINTLYMLAWSLGVKTLYYQYSLNAAQSYARKKYMEDGCSSCEG